MRVIPNDCPEQPPLAMLNVWEIERYTGSRNRKRSRMVIRKIKMLIKIKLYQCAVRVTQS